MLEVLCWVSLLKSCPMKASLQLSATSSKIWSIATKKTWTPLQSSAPSLKIWLMATKRTQTNVSNATTVMWWHWLPWLLVTRNLTEKTQSKQAITTILMICFAPILITHHYHFLASPSSALIVFLFSVLLLLSLYLLLAWSYYCFMGVCMTTKMKEPADGKFYSLTTRIAASTAAIAL